MPSPHTSVHQWRLHMIFTHVFRSSPQHMPVVHSSPHLHAALPRTSGGWSVAESCGKGVVLRRTAEKIAGAARNHRADAAEMILVARGRSRCAENTMVCWHKKKTIMCIFQSVVSRVCCLSHVPSPPPFLIPLHLPLHAFTHIHNHIHTQSHTHTYTHRNKHIETEREREWPAVLSRNLLDLHSLSPWKCKKVRSKVRLKVRLS